ncbi:unnamed protein product [marine sediment metagenome]|uniref:Uncharacterized protein n=1 Tax=marine sediment metagenome TaxID=412755 RepID=X1N1U8_9ZZZZ
MVTGDVDTRPRGAITNPFTGEKSKGMKQRMEFSELQKRYKAEWTAKHHADLDKAQGKEKPARKFNTLGEEIKG